MKKPIVLLGGALLAAVAIIGMGAINNPPSFQQSTTIITQNVNQSFTTNLFATTEIVTNLTVNNITITNQQNLAMTLWANSPSGAMDFKFSGQYYSITANSAITSFLNTQVGAYKDFISFDLTNGTGSDLTLFITASGYLANDGSRSFVVTNKSSREIRFSSSAMGIRGISQPWY